MKNKILTVLLGTVLFAGTIFPLAACAGCSGDEVLEQVEVSELQSVAAQFSQKTAEATNAAAKITASISEEGGKEECGVAQIRYLNQGNKLYIDESATVNGEGYALSVRDGIAYYNASIRGSTEYFYEEGDETFPMNNTHIYRDKPENIAASLWYKNIIPDAEAYAKNYADLLKETGEEVGLEISDERYQIIYDSYLNEYYNEIAVDSIWNMRKGYGAVSVLPATPTFWNNEYFRSESWSMSIIHTVDLILSIRDELEEVESRYDPSEFSVDITAKSNQNRLNVYLKAEIDHKAANDSDEDIKGEISISMEINLNAGLKAANMGSPSVDYSNTRYISPQTDFSQLASTLAGGGDFSAPISGNGYIGSDEDYSNPLSYHTKLGQFASSVSGIGNGVEVTYDGKKLPLGSRLFDADEVDPLWWLISSGNYNEQEFLERCNKYNLWTGSFDYSYQNYESGTLYDTAVWSQAYYMSSVVEQSRMVHDLLRTVGYFADEDFDVTKLKITYIKVACIYIYTEYNPAETLYDFTIASERTLICEYKIYF